MIHSARPIVTPVANIVFCCFVFLDLKSGDGRGRTDGRTTCAKTMIPTGHDFGLAEWIKKQGVCEMSQVKNIYLKFFSYLPTTYKIEYTPFLYKITMWNFNNKYSFMKTIFKLIHRSWKVATKVFWSTSCTCFKSGSLYLVVVSVRTWVCNALNVQPERKVY